MDVEQKCLSGGNQLVQHDWTLSSLGLLHHVNAPCWVVQPSLQGDVSWELLFHNTAAAKRFGNGATTPPIQGRRQLQSTLSNRNSRKTMTQLTDAANGDGMNTRLWVDAQQLLPLWFAQVGEKEGYLSVLCKPIKVVLGGDALNCLYIEVEEAASPEVARVMAMHHLDPIFTFLFDQHGLFLSANHKALQRYADLADTEGGITLLSLFKEGVYAGGEAAMMQEYEKALSEIFRQGSACHRFAQKRVSRKHPEEHRHVLFEMWPIQDPVTQSPAVLVSIYNITSQKEMELQLQSWRDALQQENQALERENQELEVFNKQLQDDHVDLQAQNTAMQEQKALLVSERQRLQQNLEKVMNHKLATKRPIDTDTPVDRTLNLLHALIMGVVPPVDDLLELYNLIITAGDLRYPVHLERQLMEDTARNAEVSLSLLQLLQGYRSTDGYNAPPEAADGKPPSPCQSDGEPQRGSTDGMIVPGSLVPVVERLLAEAVGNWQFDVFQLAEAAPRTPLSLLAFHLLTASGLVHDFALDRHKLAKWLTLVEEGYPDHPYHNRTHAAGVLHVMYMLLHQGGLRKQGIADKLITLGCIMSAAIHDFQHKGVNNDFLIKSQDPLAILYNDQSPLENHHLAASFKLLANPELNFLQNLTDQQFSSLRETIIQQVLATDMKRHFNICSLFTTRFNRKGDSCATSNLATAAMDAGRPARWQNLSPEDAVLILQMGLKVADVGHIAAPNQLHRRWCENLEEEFFMQGDKEKLHGLPLSALMDRSSSFGITKSQVSFFEVVGLPLIRSFVTVFEDAQPLLTGAQDNFVAWGGAL